MNSHKIAAGILAVLLSVPAIEAQALSVFVQANTVERESKGTDRANSQSEAVSVKLNFAGSSKDNTNRGVQLLGSVEQSQSNDVDDSLSFNTLALSRETRRWSETGRRYGFFSYGLGFAQYNSPQVSEVDLVGFRLGAGAGYPVFRNRVILTTDLDVQLLQEFGGDDTASREAELGAIAGKIGLLWSFNNVGFTASYSYRYLSYADSANSEIADVSQMIGVGIGFALN